MKHLCDRYTQALKDISLDDIFLRCGSLGAKVCTKISLCPLAGVLLILTTNTFWLQGSTVSAS